MNDRLTPRSTDSLWKWTVCGLLLLATMINYMDRIALNQTSKRVMAELEIGKEKYGLLESWFGVGFALGSIGVGLLVDRINVRWVYPFMVILWSLAGAATLRVQNFEQLLICRFLLGLFEAANWPCAIRTTQRILAREQRTMGNAILQSGTAVGSILTAPLVWFALNYFSSWRLPFAIVGAFGVIWAIAWMVIVRSADLAHRPMNEAAVVAPIPRDRERINWTNLLARYMSLIVVVVTINATWHFLRAWLPIFLQEARGYSENQMLWFSTGYYICADIGAMSAGFITTFLISWGWPIHRSRMSVYLFFGVLILLCVPAAFLNRGVLLIVLLLIVGCASLGVFPNYYTFTQELTVRHQGKITGSLGFIWWMAAYALHKTVGQWVDFAEKRYYVEALAQGLSEAEAKLQSSRLAFEPAVALIGFAPLIGFVALLLLWNLGLPKTDRQKDPDSNEIGEPAVGSPIPATG